MKKRNPILIYFRLGFLVFDSTGKCSNIFTRACEDILETIPVGKNIWDVLKIAKIDLEAYDLWLKAIFSEKLPFHAMKSLGPDKYIHTKGRSIHLDYFPIRDENSKKLKM